MNCIRTPENLTDFTVENLTTPTEFVTLEQAITQCNSMPGDDDTFLAGLIKRAQATVEIDAAILLGSRSARVNICLQPSRHHLGCSSDRSDGDFWNGSSGGQSPALLSRTLMLPQRCWPITSIASIKYRDSSGVQTPFTDYQASLASRPAKIGLLPNQYWPVMQPAYFDALSIDCVAGLAPDSLLPHCETAKQAVLLLVGHWFLNREAEVTGAISTSVGKAYDTLITLMQQYRYL